MKFIYLTAKRYPGTTADHQYIRNLAHAFYSKLADSFFFVVCNTGKKDLPQLPIISLQIPNFIKRTIFFFFWIPYFYLFKIKVKKDLEPVVFFSNDLNLLSILSFYKKVFGARYTIVSDWHLLSGTYKDKFVLCNSKLAITTSHKLELALSKISTKTLIKTVYGGIDLNMFNKINLIGETNDFRRKKLGLPEGKILVGYVGLFMTMGMEKGIKTMIDSLSDLPPTYFMVFVGGRYDEIVKYKEYCSSRSVSERCVFFEIQSFDKVVEYEKIMDVLVIPYPDTPHFRQYGFPMKVYEYMASGVPIVYTKLELVEEVIADCAFGIQPSSPTELARAVKNVIENREESQKVSKRSLEKVSKFSWESKAGNIINFLV
jgi:glycosyltransferase involved in cell wall biosynthesis